MREAHDAVRVVVVVVVQCLARRHRRLEASVLVASAGTAVTRLKSPAKIVRRARTHLRGLWLWSGVRGKLYYSST